MKTKILFVTLLISAMSIAACNVYGQEKNRTDRERVDSMKKSDLILQKQTDNAKVQRKESEARTKEARRVEQNASNASTESRKAIKAEKKAQKTRGKADEQAEKTKKAIEKSEQDR